MLKRLFLMLSLAAFTLTVTAVPAKRGVWTTLKLADGTEVRAQLVGDEHGHFWKAEDGSAYVQNPDADFYMPADAKTIVNKAKVRRQNFNDQMAKRLPARNAKKAQSSFLGQKKGLILLVNFSDKKFANGHDNTYFTRMANEQGFSEGKFKGSMTDYFKAQSLNLFELDFDVVGPLTVSNKYSYYGKNDSQGNDMYAGEMIIEAVKLAKNEVTDWKQYDWDDDGYVDQIYVIYAWYGEADTENKSNTIWPHAYTLSDAKLYGDGTGPVTVATGLKVDTYACGSELNGNGNINGIGTMCHEFSHCLGYPDFYDIDYSGGQGMSSWDLMDGGSYNGDGYQPAGYTSYERWVAGWAEPTVLDAEDVNVTGMKALAESAESYIIYNKKQHNEYFLLENRQLVGWDASLPAGGLLIIHVDYNATAWYNNTPNDNPSHQRMTWMPADNEYQYEMYMGDKYYTEEGLTTDTYPYKQNNAFNKDTKPAAKLYNKNTDGSYYLTSSVEDITRNADGTIDFRFVAQYDPSGQQPPIQPSEDGTLFYESFDNCDGKGGNDGKWSGTIANGNFVPDNSGWEAEKSYGAYMCAKFGTTTVAGNATTPTFTATGENTLTFKAGAWNAMNDGTTLYLTVSQGSVSPESVTLTKGAFNDFEATITATGNVQLTFQMEKGRFFLDEVLVTDPTVTAISDTLSSQPDASRLARIYSLDGRFLGTDFNQLPRGLYIVAGKKVVK